MGKRGYGTQDTQKRYLIHITNNNKLENISVGVYWDHICVPGWQLSGLLNTRAVFSYKICEKYNSGTLSVAWCLRSYWDRWTDVAFCVLLQALAQEWLWKSENIITVIFSQISITRMWKPAKEAILLYWNFLVDCCQKYF